MKAKAILLAAAFAVLVHSGADASVYTPHAASNAPAPFVQRTQGGGGQGGPYVHHRAPDWRGGHAPHAYPGWRGGPGWRGAPPWRGPAGWTGRPYWYGRPWAPRPYYGTIIAGVALGTLITVAAVGYVPARPAPNLCWYWADPYGNRGYWDYCG
jgi:hypothetical protein